MTKEETKQSLSVLDRLILLQLIPKEGNMVKLMMFEDITKKTELSKSEMESIGLIANEKGLIWDEKKAKEKLIDFSSAEKEFIKGVLVKLDGEEKLTKEHVNLYNLFVK